MVKTHITPLNKQVRQTHLSRLYFLSKGCKPVPTESKSGRVLWANGDEGYFMNEYGVKLTITFCASQQKKGSKANNGKRGFVHPKMLRYGNQMAHRLMFEAYAVEPCPIFIDSKGNPYRGVVHHVIENSFDIRMDNLMGWLTHKQHTVADKRRRAIEAVLPDMYCVETIHLKTIQDPRLTNDETFENELNKLREKYGTKDN